MTYRLTRAELDRLDSDQRAAIAGYVRHHLGPDVGGNALELEYTPAVGDDPSLIAARMTERVEHDDGFEPAAWWCCTAVPEPPALREWIRHDAPTEALAVAAEVDEAPPAKPRRIRRRPAA